MNDDNSLKCPSPMSTLSLENKTERSRNELINAYVISTLSYDTIESLASSDVTAATEEGVASLQDSTDDFSACYFLNRLNTIQTNFNNEIGVFKRDFTKNVYDVQTEVALLRKTNATLDETVEFKTIEIEKLKTEIEDLKRTENSTITTLNQKVTQHEAEIEQLKKAIEKKDRSNEILKQLLKDNPSTHDEKMKELESENAYLKEQRHGIDNVMDEVLEKNKCLEKECKHLKMSIHDFGAYADFKGLSTEITSRTVQLLEENAQLKELIEKKKASINTMKDEILISKRSQNEISRHMEPNLEYSREIDSKLEDFDKLEQLNRDLKEDLQKFKEKEIELKCIATKLLL